MKTDIGDHLATLTFQNGKFIFRCNFAERLIAKDAKFYWDATHWQTSDPKKASALIRFADPETKKLLEKFVLKITPFEGALLTPEGLKLHAYQEVSCRFMLSRNRSYDADEMGLGKTPTAVVATNMKWGQILVVCPKSLVWNWKAEFEKWSIHSPVIEIITAEIPFQKYSADVLIVPDSIIGRDGVRRCLFRKKLKWLIVDEAHRFKSLDSQRTAGIVGGVAVFKSTDEITGRKIENRKLLKSMIEHCENTAFLSGTPIPNNFFELYPAVKGLAHAEFNFMDQYEFAVRYCNAHETPFGWDYSGSSNTDELNEKLGKVMIQHFKKDVLKDLPPKTHQIFFTENNLPSEITAFEKSMLDRYSIQDIVEMETLGDIVTYRRELGLSMVDSITEIFSDEIEAQKKKKIIFAHHRDVVEKIHESLAAFNPAKLYGGMKSLEVKAQIEKFKTDPTCLAIVLNIEAGGVGLNLTESDEVNFVEFDWSPKKNEQGEDRAHRLGQKNKVLIRYFVPRGTLAEYILRANFNKTFHTNKLNPMKENHGVELTQSKERD